MPAPCRYCGRDKAWPCVNTRDMEDFAISGDEICYTTLEAHGGGEKGMRYVTLNRNAFRESAEYLRTPPSIDLLAQFKATIDPPPYRVEWHNDTGPRDDYYVEWWTVAGIDFKSKGAATAFLALLEKG